MSKNLALLIAGIVFALVSIMHLLRILYATEIMVAGSVIPMWASWLGFIVALILCVLMFKARSNV